MLPSNDTCSLDDPYAHAKGLRIVRASPLDTEGFLIQDHPPFWIQYQYPHSYIPPRHVTFHVLPRAREARTLVPVAPNYWVKRFPALAVAVPTVFSPICQRQATISMTQL